MVANMLFATFTAWACIALAYCVQEMDFPCPDKFWKTMALPIGHMAAIVLCVILNIQGVLH